MGGWSFEDEYEDEDEDEDEDEVVDAVGSWAGGEGQKKMRLIGRHLFRAPKKHLTRIARQCPI